ncbi:TetR/AcrR family transcriptional regulator [Levilactobacillus bambusae]|uniref:HTH tetR-type domain-containing protein n=1 Tax=Levilactobacillus bambusae TaxID=2024736 RepID=A0A2V1N0A9_9LACO|nr:TetR/AcrR family transcriptional regulator [Levilactobacillus bambusae]PWG00453.1 hypothetical protein DCM90_05885 [Levilactobacillus bambusae]
MTKRTELTQESLLGAIERLLQEKSLDDITVSELTRVAGISRMTFYRSYRNLVEVLEVEVKRLLVEFQQTIEYQDNYHYILQMVMFFQRHSPFIKVLIRANQLDLLRVNIYQVMNELSHGKPILTGLSEREVKYYVEYHTAGLMNVIIDWISHDQPESPEALARFLDRNAQ